jgi:hypothetical protein
MKEELEKLIAKYNKQWNKYGMGSVVAYSQVVADLEKLLDNISDEEIIAETFKTTRTMTAVEWLEEQTRKPEWHSLKRQDIFEQAKEMEKEQRQEDTNYGYSQGWDDGSQNLEPMRPEVKQQEQ